MIRKILTMNRAAANAVIVASTLIIMGSVMLFNAWNSDVQIRNAVQKSQQSFCAIIDLETSVVITKPAPGNISRSRQYRIYIDFIELGRKFNC